jgi:hypothetical protein
MAPSPVGPLGGIIPRRFARRLRMIFLYVSFIGRQVGYTARDMKRIHHCVQRQLLYCTAKPPIKGLKLKSQLHNSQWEASRKSYPREGPANGARRKKVVAMALVRGGNKSAFVPAPTARTGLPKNPAKNRHTRREPKFWENPAPSVKSIITGRDVLYTMLRPCISLNGAAKTGPNASPMTYNERPRRAAVDDTWNRSIIWCVAGVYTDEPNVL